MRVVIWAAVSTKPQVEDKDSIPSQIEAARKLILEREWYEVSEPLVIPGHSRSYIFLADAAQDMPQYTQLMLTARNAEIDLLVCRGRDRLGRTDALIAQVEEYLASYNVQVLSLSMPTEIQTPEDFATRGNRAAIWMRGIERAKAQDEVAELKARHHFGMRGRIKRGLHPNIPPLGYDREGNVVPHEAETVRRVFELYLTGHSLGAIAREVKPTAQGRCPGNHSHVWAMLVNPYYAGLVSWGRYNGHRLRPRSEWVVGEGKHEPIIDRETWEAAQREHDQRDRRTPFTSHPLSGTVFCRPCDTNMVVNQSSGRGKRLYRYYRCAQCRNSVSKDWLEGKLADKLLEWAAQPEVLEAEAERLAQEEGRASMERVEHLRGALERKQAALGRWSGDYSDGLISRVEYYERRAYIESEMGQIESVLREAESQAIDPEALRARFEEFAQWTGEDMLRVMRSDARRAKAYLRQMGLRIYVNGKDAEVVFV